MDIFQITAQELLDSRGNPTVEATVYLDRYTRVSGMVPSGASTGKYEAVELRDNEPQRYRGKGVLKAVRNINGIIAPALIGHDVTDQRGIDQKMIELDGTDNKSHLGANAILAVSIACLRAGAVARRMQFYEYVAEVFGKPAKEPFTMPIPLINVLNGGKHAIGSSDFQEYMIVPIGAPTFAEATRWAAETFHELRGIIRERGWPTTVGDEGGYAPPVESNEEPLKLIMQALERAGHTPGEDIAIALDPAASELYEDGKYHLTKDGMSLTSAEMVDLFVEWAGRYPIVSIEDGLDEEDWDGFALLKEKTRNKVQIVGDDLFATNPQRVRIGIEKNAANCVLIKANQIGTITETLDTVHLALDNGLTAIVSHRSGETEMPFEADFGVGTGVGQVKIGSVSRSERVAEYNELMRIERHLGGRAILAHFPFTGIAKA
ncbi:MAG TPA: phosphopyruvate hydratase [Sedimentisphaerales bacterium]|nr:phosphopyruvate hydratase [Sedimentisphaerales bacterium]HRS10953.1 phosphopyruvate hydratase [Sedimentisphaerales bacterium]HRV48647.1 phosphopyruvate hydratase [Sedimentisphaerales bacterium]